MTRAEKMMEKLEEQFVVVNVKYSDNTVVSIEEVEDDMAEVVAFEVVNVEDYEENFYEVEGLETTWMEVE